MNKKTTISLVISVLFLFLLSSIGYAQEGDNDPDANVNLGCLESATLSGSVPEGEGRGIPSDILWNPATNDFQTPSSWHEYGIGYNETQGGVTKDNPMYWQVEWPTDKNINYISTLSCAHFGNQPQPHTGWAIQIWVDDDWQDLAKADNGWDADTLRGTGGWINQGPFVWRGLEPVVTKKIRLCAFANPDSLADGVETFADSLWSYCFCGSDGDIKSTLVQYLDFTGAEADNDKDEMVNLGLLDECVVSAAFVAGELVGEYGGIRGEPADILFDPVKGDFNNTDTPWGEFGYPGAFDAGLVEEDDPFYWMVEWPVPKNVSYFTWGGAYCNAPQPNTPWAIQYWDDAWVTLMDGVGGSFAEGLPGVDCDAESVWQSDTPVQTTKFRLAVWSDGIDPLFSYNIRGRGGSCQNWDETDLPFKCILVQYKDITGVESEAVMKPTEFALHQNYPNPFNPQTTNIGFSLQKQSHVRLTVYNLLGQEIAVLVDAMRQSGYHQVSFDAKSLSSGVYLYQLETNQGVLTKKMLLLQ
ncbi:MAG: T9SS type A sorting domain-containing protein [Candidatus Marinimicrobia bacterium]|nr:T9SS type A sorting domain-containing protein [Candidatus Neomarinimicrobiota bacterium]